jgi:hypothetical protein
MQNNVGFDQGVGAFLVILIDISANRPCHLTPPLVVAEKQYEIAIPFIFSGMQNCEFY